MFQVSGAGYSHGAALHTPGAQPYHRAPRPHLGQYSTLTLHSLHTVIPDTSHGHMFRYGRFMHCAFHIISLNFLFLLLIDIIKNK